MTPSNFAALYDRLANTVRTLGPLSHGLRWPLQEAYESIIARPWNPALVAAAVERLLAFLSSPAGRTHANCVAVDHFFMMQDGWVRNWDPAPEELSDILGDIGGILHDTFQAPEVAEDFDSTPELLLERIRAFRESRPAA